MEKNTVIPLTMVQPGRSAEVVEVRGGRGITGRLASMGVVPGTKVSLVRGGRRGPAIVDVRGSRLFIGRGMAPRVLVKELG